MEGEEQNRMGIGTRRATSLNNSWIINCNRLSQTSIGNCLVPSIYLRLFERANVLLSKRDEFRLN